ncbi:MAG: putative PEP-binding protein [Pirellulaceae bacterium]
MRTNADSPRIRLRLATSVPRGIGLCRTEHMFFEGDRIISVREMILAERGRSSHGSQAVADATQGLRGHLQGDEWSSRDHSPVRIRRCTNSCLTTPSRKPSWPLKSSVP